MTNLATDGSLVLALIYTLDPESSRISAECVVASPEPFDAAARSIGCLAQCVEPVARYRLLCPALVHSVVVDKNRIKGLVHNA